MYRNNCCKHRQSRDASNVPDPNMWFIYANVLGSRQAVAAGVGAVVAHNLPSARQQEQEQAAELPAAPLWLSVPAPALLSFSPMELQNLILPVLLRVLEPALGIILSNLKGKGIEAEKLLVIRKAPSHFFSVILNCKVSIWGLYIYIFCTYTLMHNPSELLSEQWYKRNP